MIQEPQRDQDNESDNEQLGKRVRLNKELPTKIQLSSSDCLGVIIKFLNTQEQLKARLINRQFKEVVTKKFTSLMSTSFEKGNFQDLQQFICNNYFNEAQFEGLKCLSIPLIQTIEDIPAVNKDNAQLEKINIDESYLDDAEEPIYFNEFFKHLEPKSISLSKYKFLQYIPLNQIKELDLLKVMFLKDKSFLQNCQNLVSFAAHFHQNDSFFATPDFPEFKYLKMLKLVLQGPHINKDQVPNFKSFTEKIQNLEVLELHFDTYNSTDEKQEVFNYFLSLPKLRIFQAFNSLEEILHGQFKKKYDYFIIDNNKFQVALNLTEPILNILFGFSKVVDITNCKIEEETQQMIQKYFETFRQDPLSSCDNIVKISFKHELIQTNYLCYPIVQRNEEFTTLWGSQYYSIQ